MEVIVESFTRLTDCETQDKLQVKPSTKYEPW